MAFFTMTITISSFVYMLVSLMLYMAYTSA